MTKTVRVGVYNKRKSLPKPKALRGKSADNVRKRGFLWI